MLLEKEKGQTVCSSSGTNKNYPPEQSISNRGDFIKSFYKDLKGFIEIREISEGKAKTKYFKSVAELNNYDPPTDKNIYIGMFTRKRKRGRNEDIKQNQALWLDFDDKDSFYSFEYLVNLEKLPEPTAVINSGHGHHIYYKLDKPAGREIEPVLKELARKTVADTRAAELARVMRLPATMNVKDPEKPVKCEVLKLNDKTYKLKKIAELLGVKAKAMEKAASESKQAAESFKINYEGIISEVDWPCIKSILEGVKEGQRNWLLGRITKYFKEKMNFKKEKTKKIILVWNLKNDPPQKEQELLASFNKYWHTNYNLLGCNIKDSKGEPIPSLQQVLNKHCNKSDCPIPKTIKTGEVIEPAGEVIGYNNWLLYHIKDISAYELIIYGVLAANKQGLTAKRCSEIIGITEKTFRKYAKKSKFVSKKEGVQQRGLADLFFLDKHGTYNLKRTKVSYTAIRFLNSELHQGLIKASDIKLYMLLRYFRFKSETKEAYPALKTLSEKLGTSKSTVTRSIKRLEKRDIIEIDRGKYNSNLYKFKIV